MPNPVVHFEIAVRDDVKGREFYGKLFGWTFDIMEQMNYSGIPSGGEGGIGGGLFKVEEGQMSPYVTFYVSVDDLEATLKKAEALGGKTIMPVMPVGDMGSIAMFSDPDGNCIGLWKANAPANG